MAKATTKPRAAADRNGITVNLRDAVLETLLQLHIDFAALGEIGKAGPMLHRLMELAYYAEPDLKPRGPRKRSAKRGTKTALN